VTAYTPTQAAALLAASSGDLSLRTEIALLQKCAALYATATESDKGQIARIIRNPAGYANQMLPLVMAVANVAAPTATPTDTEITAAINTLWPVTATLGA
jgi:hypothetical protein